MLKAIIFIFSISIFNTTYAAVVDLSSRDWLVNGDNLITYDASTNLEWLDLTVTRGNSLRATESETYFIDGTWRWATIEEYFSLWTDFGFTYPGDGFSTTSIFSGGQKLRDLSAILSLLGTTGSVFTASTRRAELIGNSRLFQTSKNTTTYGFGVARINYSSSPAQVLLRYEPGTRKENDAFLSVGSFLVRDVTIVPVPAAIWLFLSGIIGLAIVSKRH